jgi:hypothetical protein
MKLFQRGILALCLLSAPLMFAPAASADLLKATGFALGVQWHAEHDPQRNEVNRALFLAFGQALQVRKRAA